MTVTTVVLRELHRVHQQLSDLKDRLERGPKQIKAREANVAKADDELAKVKADLKAARMAADQKQLLLKTGENKIGDLRVKLNQAASNREYQALTDQIAADEMANSVLADEILEALEKIDEFAPLIKDAEQKAAKSREEQARLTQQIRDQEGALASDVKRLEGELKELEKNLPGEFAEAYHRIVKSKGSDAMAPIEGENCGGCYQSLTPNHINLLLMNKVVFCLTCGRLLYLPEDRTPGK